MAEPRGTRRSAAARRIPVTVAACLVAAVTSACAGGGTAASERLCRERAERENTIYFQAVRSALPQSVQVAKASASNGCGSADNGAWLFLDLDGELSRTGLFQLFEQAGWSREALTSIRDCGARCDEATLAGKAGERILGVLIPRSRAQDPATGRESWLVMVSALDSCWDTHGYRCP